MLPMLEDHVKHSNKPLRIAVSGACHSLYNGRNNCQNITRLSEIQKGGYERNSPHSGEVTKVGWQGLQLKPTLPHIFELIEAGLGQRTLHLRALHPIPLR
jgi:hypothetical protein